MSLFMISKNGEKLVDIMSNVEKKLDTLIEL